MSFSFSRHDPLQRETGAGFETRGEHSQAAVKMLLYIFVERQPAHGFYDLAEEYEVIVAVNIFLLWSEGAEEDPVVKGILPVVAEVNFLRDPDGITGPGRVGIEVRVGNARTQVNGFLVKRNILSLQVLASTLTIVKLLLRVLSA